MIARFVSFCALKGIAPLIVSSTLLVSLSGCQTAAPVGEYAVIDGEKAAVPLIEMGDAATVRRVLDEARTNSRVMDILTELCETHGSRLTGSTACENANRWALAQFESWGLENAHLWEWGTLDARFDRLASSGAIVEQPRRRGDDEEDPEWETVRDLEFTTLSWTRGTDGPVVGRVVKMPDSPEAFDADPEAYRGAWVLLEAGYASRRGVRGVGYSMRQRNEIRHEIRTGAYDPMAAPAPETWEGTVLFNGDELMLRFMPERDDDDTIVGGTMMVPEMFGGPISDVVHDDDSLSFAWENPHEKSTLALTMDGEVMTGAASGEHAVTLRQTVGADEYAMTREQDKILKRVLEAGPAGVISASPDERVWTTRPNGWRELDIAQTPEDIEILVRRSDYDYMNSRLADGVEVHARFDLPHRLERGPIPVYNTVAEIRGTTRPDEVVIVSAHLDSWDGPMSLGTTDNGTGSSVVLEAARLLAAANAKPERTIRFVLWTGEEQGLLGSRAYVESLSDEERAKISAVFVDDGGTNYEGGIPAADYMVDYLAAATAAVNGQFYSETDGAWLDVNIRPTGDRIRTHGGSDHASFNRVGVPGFFWDEVGRADYYYGWHTQNDDLDLAIPEYLQQSSACMAITAYNLACAPGLLAREGETEGEPVASGAE